MRYLLLWFQQLRRLPPVTIAYIGSRVLNVLINKKAVMITGIDIFAAKKIVQIHFVPKQSHQIICIVLLIPLSQIDLFKNGPAL